MTGFLQLFYRGFDKAVYTFWQNPNGIWSNVHGPSQPIGGVLNGPPIAARLPGTGVVQLFYRGTDNSVWSRWRNTDGTWSNEQHIGGVLNGDPIAAQVPGTDVLQLFYRGTDNSVWSRWRNTDGSWSDEQHIGGVLNGEPSAVQLPGTDVLQLFYRATDNTLRSRWRNTNGNWSDEQTLGGVLNGNPIAAPLLGSNYVLQVVYRGEGNQLCSRWRETDGSWSVEDMSGGVLDSDPTLVQVGPDAFRVFYQGNAKGHKHGLVTRLSKAHQWGPEQPLGGNYNSGTPENVPVAVQVPGTNTLQVFYLDTNSTGVQSRSLSTSGTWTSEQNIGGSNIDGQFTVAVIPG